MMIINKEVRAQQAPCALTEAQIQQIARDIGGYPINVRARQIWKFEASMLEQFARAILAQVLARSNSVEIDAIAAAQGADDARDAARWRKAVKMAEANEDGDGDAFVAYVDAALTKDAK